MPKNKKPLRGSKPKTKLINDAVAIIFVAGLAITYPHCGPLFKDLIMPVAAQVLSQIVIKIMHLD